MIYILDEHDASLGSFMAMRVAPGAFRVKVVFPHPGSWRYVVPDPVTGDYWFYTGPKVAP
jgi:hypothetical protein